MPPQLPFFENCHLDIRPWPWQIILNLVSTERSCQKLYSKVKYEGPNSYQSKDLANVKVFADKQTDWLKTICPRSIYVGAWVTVLFSKSLYQITIYWFSTTSMTQRAFENILVEKKKKLVTNIYPIKDKFFVILTTVSSSANTFHL